MKRVRMKEVKVKGEGEQRWSSVDAASRRVDERPTASLCSGEATRRDVASTVARYKTLPPLSTSTSTSTFFKTRPPSYTYTFILHLLLSTLAFSSHAAERHWVGTTSVSASVAANWAENAVPADGDSVILDADSADKPMTWNLSVSPGGWSQTNYAGTVTFDRGTNAVVMSGDVDLASGTWTHTANPSFSSSSYECPGSGQFQRRGCRRESRRNIGHKLGRKTIQQKVSSRLWFGSLSRDARFWRL